MWIEDLIDLINGDDCHPESDEFYRLVLVRSEGDEHTGVSHRCWAYIEKGVLPKCFSNSEDELPNMEVPKYIREEFDWVLKRLKG